MVQATPLSYAIVAILAAVLNMSTTQPIVEIKTSVFNTNGLGSYSFEYETSDGAYRKEDGGIKLGEGFAVRGEYGYVDPMGQQHFVRYVADLNGFRPQFDNDDSRFNDRNII